MNIEHSLPALIVHVIIMKFLYLIKETILCGNKIKKMTNYDGTLLIKFYDLNKFVYSIPTYIS